MKLLTLVAAALLCAAAFAQEPDAKLDGVIDLDPSNIKEHLDGSKHALVEFYAPWCGHCKSLTPEWSRLGKAVAGSSEKNNILIAKVDANAHSSLGSEYGVQGFPTIKFFKKGSTEPEEYQGGRSLEDFLSFLNNKAGAKLFAPREPTDVVVLEKSNFARIVKDETKDVLVEFYAPWCGHCKKLAPDYEKVGTAFKHEKNIVIGKMDADNAANREVSSSYDVNGFPTLKWFPKGNKKGEEYTSGRSVQDFVNFINEKTGAQRDVSGLLNEKAGRDDALDAAAKAFAEAGDKAAALAALKQAVADSKHPDAALYSAAGEKVVAKGDDYATKEKARLEKLIEKRGAAADKLDNMVKRRNVLDAFE